MKLRVWASQLEASDFPPVCVFSGEAAETWWKLRARRPYLWALPFLILLILCGIGLVVSPPLGYLLSDRVTGHVPVKAKYLRRLRLLVGLSIAIIAIGVVIGVAGVLAAAGHNYSVAVFAPLLLTVGLLAVLMGISGRRDRAAAVMESAGPARASFEKEARGSGSHRRALSSPSGLCVRGQPDVRPTICTFVGIEVN